MRIWVDPLKLNSYQLTIADVTAAVRAQNAQVSAGQIGAQPAPQEQMLNATVSVQSRLQTPEQFGAIRLKTDADGAIVRLGDVARVETGRGELRLPVDATTASPPPASASSWRRAPTR